MKKKLRIEELCVDSFEAGAGAEASRGTVRGLEMSPNCASGTPSCLGTCDDTCGLTCWDTCFPDLTCTCA
jgi:hypothetical protein